MGCFLEAFSFYDSNEREIILPSGISSVNQSAFANSKKLEKVIFNDGLRTIGSSVFWNCSNLNTVALPESVTSIGNSAFYNCTSLITITLPQKLNSIGDLAFADCRNLAFLEIPKLLKEFGENVFINCDNLKINFPGTKEEFLKVKNADKVIELLGEDRIFYGPSLSKIISDFKNNKTQKNMSELEVVF